jgi:nucleoside-diphosphate-sugar epimerase
MRILVTGAAGFIGSHLAQTLASKGHDVVGVDCYSDYYPVVLKRLNQKAVNASGVTIHELDLASDDLTSLLDGVEVIYHCAAQPGNSAATSLETYVRNNITATHRLMEAVRKLKGFQLMVNISTSSVYGANATDSEDTPPKPTSNYGVTKLAAEQLALTYWRGYGIPVTSLRLFSVYGPRERTDKLYPKLIGCILGEKEFPLYEGSLEHSRSFTFVEDIMRGFLAVLDHRDEVAGEIFNIGSDIETTTGQGIETVERILGKKTKFQMLPRRFGDQLRTHANIDKARRVLGYSPKVAPEEGLRRTVEWYREEILGKVNL